MLVGRAVLVTINIDEKEAAAARRAERRQVSGLFPARGPIARQVTAPAGTAAGHGEPSRVSGRVGAVARAWVCSWERK